MERLSKDPELLAYLREWHRILKNYLVYGQKLYTNLDGLISRLEDPKEEPAKTLLIRHVARSYPRRRVKTTAIEYKPKPGSLELTQEIDALDLDDQRDRISLNYHRIILKRESLSRYEQLYSLEDAAKDMGLKVSTLNIMDAPSIGRIVIEEIGGERKVSKYEIDRYKGRRDIPLRMTEQEFCDTFYLAPKVFKKLIDLKAFETREKQDKTILVMSEATKFYDSIFPKKGTERYYEVQKILRDGISANVASYADVKVLGGEAIRG